MELGIQKTLIKEKGILRLNGFDADKISNLLAEKHSQDVFISECKNGETWGARDLVKLDAWVLVRTYSPLTMIGYEIKCSRQDFENDQKWVNYLDLCHLFYFVCPAGLIRSIDIPSRVGLIWVSSTGKLHTKKKAERVDPNVEKLNRLFVYVLMSRSRITANMNDRGEEKIDNLTLLREATERANERKELAYFVRGHLKDIEATLKKKETDLTYRENYVNDFEKRLAKLGITWDSKASNWQEKDRVDNEIDLLKSRIDYRTLEDMKRLSELLSNTTKEIDHYRLLGEQNIQDNK